MKRILYHITILLIVLSAFTACKKMDSTYSKFIVPGGLTYPGKISSPLVYAGHNRVKIAWLRGSDPKVSKARIFWNNNADSIEVPIPSTGDTISILINDLEEKSYSFMVRTYDDKGNSSIPVELLGASYGEKYQSLLLSRPINSAIIDDEGTVTLQWGSANITGGAYATDVSYTDNSGSVQTKRFAISEVSSTVSNVKLGAPLQYRTVYLPDSLSIDTFYTDYANNERYMYNKSAWAVVDYSSQHNTDPANVVTNIIDGSPATRWHTQATTSQYPHFVTIDMKSEKTITAFEIFRMLDDERACDKFQLLVSKDNDTWTDLGIFNFNRLINDGQLYEIPSYPKARYFKFIGISGPNNYMVMGEINVYGL